MRLPLRMPEKQGQFRIFRQRNRARRRRTGRRGELEFGRQFRAAEQMRGDGRRQRQIDVERERMLDDIADGEMP